MTVKAITVHPDHPKIGIEVVRSGTCRVFWRDAKDKRRQRTFYRSDLANSFAQSLLVMSTGPKPETVRSELLELVNL